MLTFLKKLWNNDIFFYFLISFGIIFLGQIPIILHFLQTPPGYYYPLIDRPSFSESYYLALIRFGMEGGLLTKVPYVVSPHQGSFIQILFPLIGKIGNFFPLGSPEIFAIFRIVGGLILLSSSVFLLRLILPKTQARVAYILFLLVQPIPFLDPQNLLPGYFEDFDHFIWHFGEAARRVSMMAPHYTLGKGLAVLSLACLILFLKKKKVRFALMGAIVGFLAGIIYPPPVFILLSSIVVSLPFVLLSYLKLWEKSRSVLHFTRFEMITKQVLPGMLVPIGYLFALLLLQYEVGKGYPWNMWNRVELGWNDPSMHFEWSYLHIIGVFLLISPFGLFPILKEKKLQTIGIFLTVWAVSGFLLFPFANFLSIGKFRFTEGVQILPLAIISMWGIVGRTVRLPRLASANLIIVCVILYFLFWSFFSTQWSKDRLKGWFTNVYFRPKELEALKFLQTVPKDSVILAGLYQSNYIPVFARVKTLIGFSDFYQSHEEFAKEKSDVDLILSGQKPIDETKKYIHDRRVEYVYLEVDPNQKAAVYPGLLERVFENGNFEIYEVKK